LERQFDHLDGRSDHKVQRHRQHEPDHDNEIERQKDLIGTDVQRTIGTSHHRKDDLHEDQLDSAFEQVEGGFCMLKSLTWTAALTAAFAAGAYAQNSSNAQPQIFHIADITSASIPTVVPGVKVKDLVNGPSGDVGVVEITNVVRHRHNRTDELLYVISGTGTATIGTKSYDIKTGDLVVLPRGTPHDFKSTASVRVLGIAYPKDDPQDFDRLTP
jgi:mannose-6-phosphate isomerase-like protein (cupin superfamily)